MNSQHHCSLAKRRISLAATLSALTIGLSCPAQTGRVYTSEDYTRAANLLTASTVSLVDHAVEGATFFSNNRFWYLDSDHGLSTLMIADAAAQTKSPAYDPVRMAAALHAAGMEQTDPKRIEIDEFALLDDGRNARITVDGVRYKCSLGADYHCAWELAGPPGCRETSLQER